MVGKIPDRAIFCDVLLTANTDSTAVQPNIALQNRAFGVSYG